MALINYRDIANSLASGGWGFDAPDGAVADNGRSAEQMRTAALIDIMRSLRTIARVMQCSSTATIPWNLQKIERLARQFVTPNKRKPRKRKATR